MSGTLLQCLKIEQNLHISLVARYVSAKMIANFHNLLALILYIFYFLFYGYYFFKQIISLKKSLLT